MATDRMTPNPNPSPEVREERTAWLRDRLLYAIQFHMWADATAAEVEEVIESLSDSDEYDPNVAALVQMPKWCSPCEAQQGVDAFFASPQTLPAPGEVELRKAAEALLAAVDTRNMRGRDHVPSMRNEQVARSRMAKALAASPTLATVAAANDEGVVRLRTAIERALQCTPSILPAGYQEAHIVYDCGDPWEILREALTTVEKADDEGVQKAVAGVLLCEVSMDPDVRWELADKIAAAIRLLSQGGGKA